MSLNTNNLIVTMAAELLAEEEAELDAELTAKWHIFNKRVEKTEEAFKPKLVEAFEKQKKAVLSAMRGKPVPDTREAGAKVIAQIGDEVQHSEGIGVITDIFPATNFIHRTTILEVACERVSLLTSTKQEFTKTIHLCDAVLLKASEEAEAAAESYVNSIFKLAVWIPAFEKVGRPFITLAYEEGGQAAFTEIGIEAAFNVTNPRAKRILKERVFKFSDEVNQTTQRKLRKTLAEGFDKGESITQISQRVADVFKIAKGSRTDMIAQTEILGASNQATHEGYIESEIVITKVWIDSRDAKVRDTHRIDGQERKMKERFSNGLLHPHDPGGQAEEVINCRCALASGKLKEAA